MDDEPLASGWVKQQPTVPDPVVGELHSPAFYFDQLLSNDLPDELRARIEKEKARLRLP